METYEPQNKEEALEQAKKELEDFKIFKKPKETKHEELDPDPVTQIELELTRLEEKVESKLSDFRYPEGCDSTYTYWVGKSESLEEIRSFIRNLRRKNYIYDAEWKSSLQGEIDKGDSGNVTIDLVGIQYKDSKWYRGQKVKVIIQEE